jgi:hypothetical protein
MNPVWPTPLEKELLLACFAAEEEASVALRRCSCELAGADGELAATQFLALVYRRWPGVENRAVELGRQAYFATWKRNREIMGHLGEIADRFGEDGIEWMALKGAALTLRQHADLGVRGMTDLDVLIRSEDLGRAALLLNRSGYRAEENATPDALVRQARVRHAWQFFGEPDRNFDLHWRPVNRCYSPEVTRLFWENAETVHFGGRAALVPAPAEQLFHVCVHGLQWDWTRKIRWIADALSVLREPVNWERVYQLGESARMSFRLANALEFLREGFRAPIPPDLPGRLIRGAAKWECGEYRLLLKPCPLGFCDSFAWHAYHFRRIRPFDDGWRRAPLPVAWPQYLAAFLNASGGLRSLCRKLRPQLMLRLERVIRRRAGSQP